MFFYFFYTICDAFFNQRYLEHKLDFFFFFMDRKIIFYQDQIDKISKIYSKISQNIFFFNSTWYFLKRKEKKYIFWVDYFKIQAKEKMCNSFNWDLYALRDSKQS